MARSNTAGAIELDTITIHPMTLSIGAEISGVDFTKPVPDAQAKEIWDAMLEWKVIFFRNQFIDNEQFIRVARQFGEPTPGHHVYGGLPDHPEIYHVAKNRKKTREAEAPIFNPWQGWHADVTPALNPPKVSMLRGEIVPAYGGDTMWTDLHAAYDTLSETMKGFVDGLRGIHNYNAKSTKPTDLFLEQVKTNLIVTEHPIVRVHPETGKRALYVSPNFLKQIANLSPTEGEAILAMLKTHAVRPEFTCRFKWEPGSIAMWDNRSTVHIAPRDILDTDLERDFYRITLLGDVPVGPDGRKSVALEGEALKAA
jgi:alpha-ketoglutarate-dependent taurine dioxygenase